jgi:hypothetical protein
MSVGREETEDEVRWGKNEKCQEVHTTRFPGNKNFS